jgi:1-acyl-sn-glycerol-3-phosphate acyltransferase
MKRLLLTLYEYLSLYLGLSLLGLLCLLWLPFALVLYPLLSRRRGGACGRLVIMAGFRLYLHALTLLGACRFDLAALDGLRGQGPLIIAPNHPCMLDAVMVLSRLPDVVCIMKSGLAGNLLLGPAARLACYIRNHSPLEMILQAVEALHGGSQLLVFPEGTRTDRQPIGEFKGGLALIAERAGIPVQTVLIESDSAYLSKGWPLFRKPTTMPISYRVRLGRRFQPSGDAKVLTRELETYFAEALAGGAFPSELSLRAVVAAVRG